jgi:hypothetical protein
MVREARQLAEEAQKNAAPAEAQLGRVGRLEAEVLSLKTATVGENRGEAGNLCDALREAAILALRGARAGWNSAIVPDFPKLFEDFKTKQFIRLWRGSRDGFGVRDFHRCCDAHANTLTEILDTKGNIFGVLTPVELESTGRWSRADPSLKSFLFTLKNPHNVPTRRFVMKAKSKDEAIMCNCNYDPLQRKHRQVD